MIDVFYNNGWHMLVGDYDHYIMGDKSIFEARTEFLDILAKEFDRRIAESLYK